ncbi:MAG: FkbM family methyltransferase [Burkholderiales bacterium]
MIELLKRALRRSPLYTLIQQRRWRLGAERWSDDDQRLLTFYRQFIRPDALCFDVGANVGNRTKIFLALGARVVAIEPQDDCVAFLRRTFGADPRLSILENVLGACDGTAELMISEVNTLSSLSPEWVQSVRASGRFADHRWRKKKHVTMTTLDRLIDRFGVPSFVKIDVEGFEREVIKGLSQPVGALSIEFAPEGRAATIACIEHLEALGPIEANYSPEETMCMAFGEWVSPKVMVEYLHAFKNETSIFGDVYMRTVVPS